MRWAMSGEVENGDGKPVDPSLEGVRKPLAVQGDGHFDFCGVADVTP